eukprot:6187707-Pleurochrysis_carterae.AAC.1
MHVQPRPNRECVVFQDADDSYTPVKTVSVPLTPDWNMFQVRARTRPHSRTLTYSRAHAHSRNRGHSLTHAYARGRHAHSLQLTRPRTCMSTQTQALTRARAHTVEKSYPRSALANTDLLR